MKTARILALACAPGLLLSAAILVLAPALENFIVFTRFVCAPPAARMTTSADLRRDRTTLNRTIARLLASISDGKSDDPYLIVNTIDNQFDLTTGQADLRRGKCSSGSYILLKANDKRTWIFETPRGMFTVLAKIESPVWRMPDWAFVEDGKPVPPANADERFEPGVLGDYALLLGHGYMIHGTIYQRFLGLPVTHGCVRLGDEDLKTVYANMHVGSKVYMY
jgi:L,D-transpeptidase ErfK/SrfK